MADAGVAGRRVLIVEDDYFIASGLAEAFARAGAEVVGPLPSVGQAAALMEARSDIHVAILDVNLGDAMIYPVADTLIARGVAVLFNTGYDAAVIPPRLGAVPRLEKPIDADAVVRAAGRAIAAGEG